MGLNEGGVNFQESNEQMCLAENSEKSLSLFERFNNHEELTETELAELLKKQLVKIGKADEKYSTCVALIPDPELRKTLEESSNIWKEKEVKGKLNTNEGVNNVSSYLPKEIQGGEIFVNHEKQMTEIKQKTEIDTVLETLGLDEKMSRIKEGSEVEGLSEKKQKTIDSKKQEIMREIEREKAQNSASLKEVWNSILGFLKKILGFFKGLLPMDIERNNSSKKEKVKSVEIEKEYQVIEGKKVGGKIKFEYAGKSGEFEIKNDELSIKEPELQELGEKLVVVDNQKYLIKDGMIYNWIAEMKKEIKQVQGVYSYEEFEDIKEAFLFGGEDGIDKFTYQNRLINKKILRSLFFIKTGLNADDLHSKQRFCSLVDRQTSLLHMLPLSINDTMSKDECNTLLAKKQKEVLEYIKKGHFTY